MLCNYRISKIITSSKKGLQINHPYGVKYISIFHLIFVWVQAIYTMFLFASSSFPVSPQLWQVVFPRSMQVALLVRTRISLNELNRVQQSSAYSPLVIKLAQTSHTIKNSKRYLKEKTLISAHGT